MMQVHILTLLPEQILPKLNLAVKKPLWISVPVLGLVNSAVSFLYENWMMVDVFQG